METILFINNSFNFNKTGSSRFFYDFLCEHYNVDVELEENDSLPYETINQKNYFAIISFYYMADFSKLTCKNLIYVPMYDGFIYCRETLNKLKNVKIINFCKKLHKQSLAFGLKSIYLKYYPELNYNENTTRDKLFYWQRRNTSFSQLLECFPEKINEIDCSKTILHSVTDGDNEPFIKPSEEEIKNYNIEITNWFEKKSDLLDILDSTKYYIAPRKQEGIGLSFLDAMSRGCVIIAHNDCTMNEYINDGINGYLIDFDNPKKIKFKDYLYIKNNSLNTYKEGREEYIEKLSKLISFIDDTRNSKKRIIGNIIAIIYFVVRKLLLKFGRNGDNK